jgi:N-glycosylase/DNA lyase
VEKKHLDYLDSLIRNDREIKAYKIKLKLIQDFSIKLSTKSINRYAKKMKWIRKTLSQTLSNSFRKKCN